MAAAACNSTSLRPSDKVDDLVDTDDRCGLLSCGPDGEGWDDDGCPDAMFAFNMASGDSPSRERAISALAHELELLGGRFAGMELVASVRAGESQETALARASELKRLLVLQGVDPGRVALKAAPGTEPTVSMAALRCESNTRRLDWWKGPTPCPAGTEPQGHVQSMVLCMGDKATPHGRFSVWQGTERYVEGAYVRGKRHGIFGVWHMGKRVGEARFIEGKLAQGERLYSEPIKCDRPVRFGDCDGDGVADAVDFCPLTAEDRDGYIDDDGCPEPDIDDGCPVQSHPCLEAADE